MIPFHLHFQGYDIGLGGVLLVLTLAFYSTLSIGLAFLTGLISIGLGFAWNAYFSAWTYE